MEKQALINPKVFISYSWTTTEHEEWVVELATRLMQDGIEVILDKWDLKEGHDIFAFMESMVKSSEAIDKVLIICDKGYKEKADNRVGGVGTEAQIITPQIYSDIQQEKFIPIVAGRDKEGNHFIPTYIATRLYIDLSSSDGFEENYDKLIRNIYKVPLHKKPAMGKRPEYLFQEEAPHYKTSVILRQMKVTVDKYPNRLKSLWESFVDAFLESLKELEIEEVKESEKLDDYIIEKINSSIPLRNDYIEALKLVCLADTIESDQLIEFFEKIYVFTEFQGNGTYLKTQFDQFKFLITELFLYTVTLLLKDKKYTIVSQILNTDYFVDSKFKSGRALNFTSFRFYLESLDYRKQKLKSNRISIHADLIKERTYGKLENELITTDLSLYYISKLTTKQENSWGSIWYPVTYIYFNEGGTIRLLNRLKSISHFEKVKVLFNIETKDELKQKVTEFQSDRGFTGSFHGIPNIRTFILAEDICTLP